MQYRPKYASEMGVGHLLLQSVSKPIARASNIQTSSSSNLCRCASYIARDQSSFNGRDNIAESFIHKNDTHMQVGVTVYHVY